MSLSTSPGVHLVTFGGGSFEYRRSVRRIVRQATRTSLFASVLGLTDLSLPRYHPECWVLHGEFMKSSDLGFGYWVWKSMIIEKRLREIPPGDVLLYIDSGCELNLEESAPISRLRDYVNYTVLHGSLAMQMLDSPELGISLSEKYYSKSELVSKMKPQASSLESNQLLAAVIFFKNDGSSRDFLNEWYAISIDSQYSLLLNDLSTPEVVGFKAHRNDQSIFSILYKEAGRFYIADETYWKPNWDVDGLKFPIWSIRNRTGISKGRMKVPDGLDRAYRIFQRYKS